GFERAREVVSAAAAFLDEVLQDGRRIEVILQVDVEVETRRGSCSLGQEVEKFSQVHEDTLALAQRAVLQTNLDGLAFSTDDGSQAMLDAAERQCQARPNAELFLVSLPALGSRFQFIRIELRLGNALLSDDSLEVQPSDVVGVPLCEFERAYDERPVATTNQLLSSMVQVVEVTDELITLCLE